MARFAPVVPIPMAKSLKEAGRLGTYHLLLAHDVLERPADYEEVYKDDDMFIIMDNSVIELNEPLDGAKIAEAAAIVDADVTVLPDYLLDKDRTLEASGAAVKEYVQQGLKSFMAVPQGKTYDELKESARYLAELPGVQHWGVGRFITEDISGTRSEMQEWLHDFKPHFGVHLLGFSDNIADDIYCAMAPYVAGIDSAVPIRCGLHGIELHTEMQDHPPRGDYWETAKDMNPVVRQNLDWFRQVIGDK